MRGLVAVAHNSNYYRTNLFNIRQYHSFVVKFLFAHIICGEVSTVGDEERITY